MILTVKLIPSSRFRRMRSLIWNLSCWERRPQSNNLTHSGGSYNGHQVSPIFYCNEIPYFSPELFIFPRFLYHFPIISVTTKTLLHGSIHVHFSPMRIASLSVNKFRTSMGRVLNVGSNFLIPNDICLVSLRFHYNVIGLFILHR